MWTTAAGGRGMAARNGMGRHPCERDFSERDTSTRPRERDFAGSGQPTRPIASPHDTASHGLRLVATIKLQRYLLESRVQIPGQAYFASSKPAPLHCRKIQACSVQETCVADLSRSLQDTRKHFRTLGYEIREAPLSFEAADLSVLPATGGGTSRTDADNSSLIPQHKSVPASIAVSAIAAYKSLISPLLPNVCRFQPTCSSYGIEAYEQFGVAKGSVLLVWRLLRCNPFRGGYQGQYDPPAWPPVGLGRLFH